MPISKDSFDESMNYRKVIKFQGTPGLDSEFNEAQDILRKQIENTVALLQENKSFLDTVTGYHGFEITQAGSPVNNFTIKAGEAIVDGIRVVLASDVSYTAQSTFTALTPPAAGTRRDEIYLEVTNVEIGVADDASIGLTTPTGTIESSRRLKQSALVKVAVGTTTPASNGSTRRFLLAILTRSTSTSIVTSMIDNVAFDTDAPQIPAGVVASTGYDEYGIQDASSLAFGFTRPRTNFVRIQWGDEGSGTGASNTLSVTTTRYGAYTTNMWIGHTLTDSAGAEFTVVSNTSGAFTVVGTPASGTFTVGPNANTYHVVLVPTIASVIQWPRAQQRVVNVKGIAGVNLYAVLMSCEFAGLPAGVVYNCYVASEGQDSAEISKFSAAVSVTTGSATPLVMSTITAQTENYGVKVDWPKVDGAFGYEVAYNNDNAVADFGNPRHMTFVTNSTSCLLKGLAGDIIQVGVRAVDGSGQVSSNYTTANAVCGGVSLERNVKLFGPIPCAIVSADNTQDLRTFMKFTTENGIQIIRLAVYVQAWTCGTPCAGGLNDGKIRVFREGDESSVVNVVTSGVGLVDQVAALTIPSAGVIVVDAWDSYWNSVAPSVYPEITGLVVITYIEGEFITTVVAEL